MSSNDSLGLGNEVDAGSTLLDLARVPLGASLLQMAALAFRNAGLEARANREFASLQAAVDATLVNAAVGHLVEVSLYIDEFGSVAIPSGQMVYSIGVGIEPLDALAEHLRHPQLRSDNSSLANMRNVSYFVWVRRQDGRLKAQTIACEFRQRFLQLGDEEARRRELLGSWRRALPHDPYASIARAEYWADVEQTRAQLIADAQKRQELASLVEEMCQEQKVANDLYRRYQETEARLQEQSKFIQALQTVSSLATLFKTGLEVHDLVCTKNGTPVVGSDLNPEVNQSRTIDLWIREGEVGQQESRAIQVHLQGSIDQIRELDLRLERVFRDAGIPVPDRGPILP